MESSHFKFNNFKNKVFNKGSKLYDAGFIEESQISEIDKSAQSYNLKIPQAYAEKILIKDETDPVWKTAIPSTEELKSSPGESSDPISDERFSPVKGIIHRYPDRVLLMPTNICAVYCRYCFRKNTVGQPNKALKEDQLSLAISYIKNHSEIWEVILSGGDPLILSNKKLAHLMDCLNQIEHVKVIRFHTRIPVVSPSRIDDELIHIIKRTIKTKKAVYVITHINHLQEIDMAAEDACALLVDNGIPLLNQSVLLKGINDNEEQMKALLKKLIEIRIKPYYLHHLDLTEGTNHFRTSIEEGQYIMKKLRGNISGLCQPNYMLDIPGGYGKVPINHNYIGKGNDGWRIEDINENIHDYRY